jgi:2-amino-4-hydroxy-6-hydroxymethyldihydropteridine diphosphokinase
MQTRRIAFGLGSNLGDRAAYLHAAYDALTTLPQVTPDSLRMSPILETAALLTDDAPTAWNIPFLNCVVVATLQAEAHTAPEALLTAVKHIEQQLGRQDRGRWSPREIDIDIITIEGVTWASPTLQLPHPAAHKRKFVLAPLCTLWADAPLAEGFTATTAWQDDTPITWWQAS